MKNILKIAAFVLMSLVTFAQKKSNEISFDSTHTIERKTHIKCIYFSFYQDFKKIKSDSSRINYFISDVIAQQESKGWSCITQGPTYLIHRAHDINRSTDSTKVHIYLYTLSFERSKKIRRPFPIYVSHVEWDRDRNRRMDKRRKK